MECVASDAGLLSGLWHGLTALFTLIADVFWDVTVYDHCQQSWWYDLGFLAGFGLTVYAGIVRTEVAFLLFFTLFLLWLIWVIFTSWVGIGIVLAVAMIVMALVARSRRDKK